VLGHASEFIRLLCVRPSPFPTPHSLSLSIYIYIYTHTHIALGQANFDIMGTYLYNIVIQYSVLTLEAPRRSI